MKLTGEFLLKAVNEGIRVGLREFPRAYLGMSGLGHPCRRYIWASWRWYAIEDFSPRLRRLFDRGHKEEFRVYRWLRLAGAEVIPIDFRTGEQFEFISCDGHVKGHCDGIINFHGLRNLEIKTMNDANFKQAVKINRIQQSQPKHYYQNQRYMHALKMDEAVYVAVNKNTDALHFEIVEKNERDIEWLLDRENELIGATTLPPAMHTKPNKYPCTMCGMHEMCFGKQKPVVTCRSCKFGALAPKGAWKCLKRKKDPLLLRLSEQLRACPQYELL